MHQTIPIITEDKLCSEYQNEIFPQFRELCQIFHHTKRPLLTFGTHISLRFPSCTGQVKPNSPYFMIVLPQLQPYLSIKPIDFAIYNSEKSEHIPKSLLLHKTIYDLNPDINFIIHSHDKYVDAVSSMKCGLLNLSTNSAMLKTIVYYEKPIYTHRIDESDYDEHSLKMKESRVLFLRCNGALCCGSNIKEAFHYLLHLEAASKIQILTMRNGCSVSDSLFTCDPDYCDLIDTTINMEFFNTQYTTILTLSQNEIIKTNRLFAWINNNYNKSSNTSVLNASSIDEISMPNYVSGSISLSHELVNRPNSLHETTKVNIPKCESTRENILSYEFRSNITSTASNHEKSNDEPEEMPMLRRAKRFKAKRCCSLTSGVEKAIARKVFNTTNPFDDRQM